MSRVHGALPIFTGDNFFCSFERITSAIQADEAQRFIFLRGSMKSVADMVLQSYPAKPYATLKALLLDEYNCRLTMEQAYRNLRDRRWREDEPLMLWVEHLLQRARNSNIAEKDVVLVITDHLSSINPHARGCHRGHSFLSEGPTSAA